MGLVRAEKNSRNATMVRRNNQQKGGWGGVTGINMVRFAVVILWFAKPNLTLFVLLFLSSDAGESETSAAAWNTALERRLLRRCGGGTIGKCFCLLFHQLSQLTLRLFLQFRDDGEDRGGGRWP